MRLSGESRPFTDLAVLNEMLELRRQGWSLLALAHRYQVSSHRAIQYHCLKAGIEPGKKGGKHLTVYYHSSGPIFKSILGDVLRVWTGEDVLNPGRTYAEYLQEAKQRNQFLHV